MIDYPPGEWSPLLVGSQWVSGTTVTILANSIANRRGVVSNFSNLYEMAQTALNTTLAGQEGVTADATRDMFRQGADEAFRIAESNEAYAKAYQHSHNSVIALRHLLTDIAEKGNKEINDAQSSNVDFETKVARISEVIADCQRQANQKAAGCAGDIMDAGQDVFAAQDTDQSFRGLAHGNSIDNLNQQPDLKAIEDQVRGKLNQATSGDYSLAAPGAPPPAGPVPGAPASALTRGGNAIPDTPAPAPPPAGLVHGAPASALTRGGNAIPGTQAPASALGGNAVPAAPAPPAASGGGSPNLSAPSMPSAPGVSAAPGLPTSSMPGAGSTPATGMPQGWAPANPGGLSSGLNTGAPASAPTSSGSASPPAGPVQAMDSQLSQASQAAQAAATFPSSGAGSPVTADDMPAPAQHASASHAAPAPPAAYSPEPRSPMASGPAVASPVSAAPASAGPLPGYGTDLRPPPGTSAPAGPVSQLPPPSAVSGWAPVSPSAGQVGMGQSAMAPQPGPLAPLQSQPGMGPQVVMATASGALAGAMSADATARDRLQRLLAAVARQQPLLAWAVGDRPDGTTVLVTDLASGWIPPDVDIPAAVTLLEPARRRGGLETLLGEVNPAASYTPGHYVDEHESDEPVATSSWRRLAPDVDELSWQLSDVTHWRDGLPRLAHTLANAASRGTGVLESEAEELRVELTKLADRVLESYPDNVNAAEVGNWQLLAAIDALVTDDWNAANYHLAWFLACNTAEVESVPR